MLYQIISINFMDKEQYLKKKEILKLEEKLIPRRVSCFKCFRPKKNCLCHKISKFSTNVHIAILIHPMEAKKEKIATGRLTHQTLINSSLISGVNFTHHKKVNHLIHNPQNQCYVLYPGNNAINLSEREFKIFDHNKNIVIFVIDGTWPCAKKMMKLSTNIQKLPRISFNIQKKSNFFIKQQPDNLCLSTIESVDLLLTELNRLKEENLHGHSEKLLAPFCDLVNYQVKCAIDPQKNGYRRKGGYKRPEERRANKSKGRKTIFDK